MVRDLSWGYFRDSIRANGVIKNAGDTPYTFEELKSIEKQRREILLRAELPLWRILLFWSGTCLKEVSTNALVWATMSVYVAIRIYANLCGDVPAHIEQLSQSNISVLGGFLSFFLVLFVNQTSARFLQMYGFSKACSGRIQDVAGMARAHLPPELGDRLVRHFNAAQIAGYVRLNAIGQCSPYGRRSFFDVHNAQYRLLAPEEARALEGHDMDNSGLCMKELCTWCQVEVAEALRAGHLNGFQEALMQNKILDFRAAMDGIYDYTDQPPHFFYINFICLLSALYLPLFAVETAFAAGWADEAHWGLDVLNGLIVLLQCIFVVGLRSLGTKMIDPYGSDVVDLSVILYVEATLEICSTVMNSRGGITTIQWTLPPAPMREASTVLTECSSYRAMTPT